MLDDGRIINVIDTPSSAGFTYPFVRSDGAH
jgi:hypothetical protein